MHEKDVIEKLTSCVAVSAEYCHGKVMRSNPNELKVIAALSGNYSLVYDSSKNKLSRPMTWKTDIMWNS